MNRYVFFFCFIQMYKMCWSLMRVRFSLTLKECVVKAEKGQRETCGIVTMRDFSNYENVCTEAQIPSLSTTGPSHLSLILSITRSPSLSLGPLIFKRYSWGMEFALWIWNCWDVNIWIHFNLQSETEGERKRESENGKEKDKGWAMKGY